MFVPLSKNKPLKYLNCINNNTTSLELQDIQCYKWVITKDYGIIYGYNAASSDDSCTDLYSIKYATR